MIDAISPPEPLEKGTTSMTATQVEAKQLFIDGAWREPVAGRRADVVDPSTGQVVATVADEDV